MGTPYNIDRKSLAVGGWGWSKLDHKSTLLLHLARFSAKLRIQDGAECGNKNFGSNILAIKTIVPVFRKKNQNQFSGVLYHPECTDCTLLETAVAGIFLQLINPATVIQ